MSKSVSRVFFSTLMALAFLVGIYTTVRGATPAAGTRSGRVHIAAASNFHSGAFPETRDQTQRDCDSDSAMNPEDY